MDKEQKQTQEELAETIVTDPLEGQGGDDIQDTNKKLVSELIELRKKKANAEKELEDYRAAEKAKADNPNAPIDVEETVKRVLQQKEEQEKSLNRELNKEEALNEFKESTVLFKTDNDPDGSKFELIKKELEKFDLSKLDTKEQFKDIYSSAAKLAGFDIKETKTTITTPSFSPTPAGSAPSISSGIVAKLSTDQRADAQRRGLSEERYAELLSKYF
jgi:hypothetical protein